MLTSGEVQQLLEACGQKLSEVSAAPLDFVVSGVPDSPHLYGIPGGSGLQTLQCSTSYRDAGVVLYTECLFPFPQALCIEDLGEHRSSLLFPVLPVPCNCHPDGRCGSSLV